ncbi:MAG TPA: ABC transporter permease [Beijerinckiaceae bacterium]|jgi:NitT/TauT family transport system permease protein
MAAPANTGATLDALGPVGSSRRSPVPFRGGGFQPGAHLALSVAGLAAFLALWQLAFALRWVNPVLLPGPVEVARALADLVSSGELAEHLAASLYRIALGFALGAVGGMALGIAIGLSTVARSVGVPGVNALFPIPKIAIMPILILWLGIGEAPKVATIALGVFFPMAVSTFGAIDNVPRNLVRMAQSFGVPFLDVVRKVMLPGALPGILSGLRISASIALLLVVAAEMIGADRGIGAFVMQAGNLMQTDRLLAGVAVLSVLGLLIGMGLARLERALLAWR